MKPEPNTEGSPDAIPVSFQDLLAGPGSRAAPTDSGCGPPPDHQRQSVILAPVLILGGLFASATLVWSASGATFTSGTSSSGNSWSAGTVTVGDDDASAAMFSPANLIPGSTGSKCIVVSYSGSVAASIKLYTTAASATGTLGPYLDLTVEQGTGGSFSGGCGAFVPVGTIFSGTLATFAAVVTNFSTGIGTFTPSGTGQTRVYKLTYTLEDNNSAQGLSGGIGFTWEARNT